MLKILEPYILTFIPIFVAVDAIGNVPLFLSLVEGVSKKERKKAIIDSIATATIIAISFVFVGKLVLRFLGITISDFQIAGGALLFIISARLLLPGAAKTLFSDKHDKEVGIFPLGTPLITGPAVLTTTLIMLNTYGLAPTFVSLLLNMFVVWLSLVKADFIIRLIGSSGSRAISKIMYILLAAIAVMMVRSGLTGLFLK
ncbi:MAG: MarC family protein [Candidatus Omnitrophica bacterium]|nr:MarC family protein [Candidatus Omnitrophota bacterium]MCG2706680.1 MarC family protein [Candidatus Omnitrophota bacterium]